MSTPPVASVSHLNGTTPAAPAGHQNVAWQQGTPYPGTVTYMGITYDVTFTDISANLPEIPGTAGITIDGGSSMPSTGTKGFIQIPYAGTITGWTIIADQPGSCSIDIKKSTYSGFPTTASIVASAPPTLSSVQKNTSTTLTGWTILIAAGDILEFDLSSVSVCTRITLSLTILRS